jgi:YidC/Oxa1 family membrane protein insertase
MDSDKKRLFLALFLSAAAIFLWQWFFMPDNRGPVPGAGSGSGSTSSQQTTQIEIIPPGSGEGTEPTLSGQPEIPAETAPTGPVDTREVSGNGFWSAFSNDGAILYDHQILEPEQYIPRQDFAGIFPREALNARRLDPGEHRSFGVTAQGVPELHETSQYQFMEDLSQVASAPEAGTEPPASALDRDPDEDDEEDQNDDASRNRPHDPTQYSRLVYRWSDGTLQVDKIFSSVDAGPYVTNLRLVFRNLGQEPRAIERVEVHTWAEDRNPQSRSFFNPVVNSREAACYVNGGLENEGRRSIEGQAFQGPTQWAGVQDRYFLTAVSFPENPEGRGCLFTSDGEYLSSVLLIDGFTLEPGSERAIDLIAYTGPKDENDLEAAATNLDRSVDYGWFGFLARPMKWILTLFYKGIPNWGVAIILLTILVKLLTFPWTQKSFKSMEGLKKIQPKLKELKEKYENDKTRLTEETMKLYKEHNVSPLGGCLPMLLQMPIYIALYRMIYSSVELYKAGFALWINDMSRPDPTYVLPILMTAAMFGQQLLMPNTADNPQTKWMMRLMPVLMGAFMLVLPSGLVLYIFVSSLLGMLQQYLIRRKSNTPAMAGSAPALVSTSESSKRANRESRRSHNQQGRH